MTDRGGSGAPPDVPRGELLSVVAVSAVFVYLALFRAGTFIYAFDRIEGAVWFDEPFRVLDGDVMYRDFFQFLGPATVHLNTALLALFGARPQVIGYSAVALGAILAGAFHVLSASLVGSPWRLVPPAAFLALAFAPHNVVGHKVPALLCALAALVVLVRRGLSGAWAFVAGALFGLGCLFSQDYGSGAALGITAYLLTRRPRLTRSALLLCCGLLAPVVVVMGAFAAAAGAQAVFYDWVVFPLVEYKKVNRLNIGFHSLYVLLKTQAPRTTAQLFFSLGSLAGALALLRGRTSPFASHAVRGPEGERTRLVAWAGLALFLATAHRGIYVFSLMLQCAVLLVVLPKVAEALEREGPPTLRLASRALFCLAGVGLLVAAAELLYLRQFAETLTLERHRAGIVWASRPMPELAWIEAQTRPGDRVFLLPDFGGYHLLSLTRNATSFSYFQEGQMTQRQARQALAEIGRTRPAAGVWNTRAFVTGPVLRTLQDALARDYDWQELPNGARLMTRKPER